MTNCITAQEKNNNDPVLRIIIIKAKYKENNFVTYIIKPIQLEILLRYPNASLPFATLPIVSYQSIKLKRVENYLSNGRIWDSHMCTVL